MKLNKRIAQWSGAIASIAFIISLFTNFCCDSECSRYATNVLIGLFSSGILVCGTSIITYFHERKRALYLLYDGCFTFLKQFEKNLRHDNQINIYALLNNYNDIIISYKKDIYFHVCELAILSKRSNLRKLIMNIWESSRHVYLFVLDDREILHSFLQKEISEEKLKSIPIKHNSSESIAYIEKLGEDLETLAYHMNFYNMRKNAKTEEKHNAD